MYQPRKNKFIFSFFSWYIQFILKKDFASLKFNSITIRPEESVLLIANHFSWWDGFIVFHLNKWLFRKQFYVLVSGDNYRKVSFLKYLGAFAAENSGRDIITTLDYAGALLADTKNLVLIFPQGKLYSNHSRSINFEKGVMQVLKSAGKKVNVVFSATFIDYFSRRKPTAHTYLQLWETEEYMSLQLLKSAYNKHYDQSLVKQTQIKE